MCKNCKSTAEGQLISNENFIIEEKAIYDRLQTVIKSVANKGRKCNTQELNEMVSLYDIISKKQNNLNLSDMNQIYKLYNQLTLILMNNKNTNFDTGNTTQSTIQNESTILDESIEAPIEEVKKVIKKK